MAGKNPTNDATWCRESYLPLTILIVVPVLPATSKPSIAASAAVPFFEATPISIAATVWAVRSETTRPIGRPSRRRYTVSPDASRIRSTSCGFSSMPPLAITDIA